MKLTDIFKMFGDDTRLRIFNLLIDNKLCVCEIETILEITQSNASRHLNRLKTAGLIRSAKDSQWIYYTVSEDFIADNSSLYIYLKEKLSSTEECVDDINKLHRYQKSSFTRSDVRENRDDVVSALKISCGCKK